VLSFREILFMVAPQVLGQVVIPGEAVLTDADTLVHGAVYVFLFVSRFDVSGKVRFAAEKVIGSAGLVFALFVGAIDLFPRVPVPCGLISFGGGCGGCENAISGLWLLACGLGGLLNYNAMLVFGGALAELRI
jgi:hypothetical protein